MKILTFFFHKITITLNLLNLLWLWEASQCCNEFKSFSVFSLCRELFLKVFINVPKAKHACFWVFVIAIKPKIRNQELKLKLVSLIAPCLTNQKLRFISDRQNFSYLYLNCLGPDIALLQLLKTPAKT